MSRYGTACSSSNALADYLLWISRPSSLFVADQYVSSPSLILPPPPPPRSGDGPRPESLRRHNVGRLPALTTNLTPHTAQPLLQTPLSTTSLSSPFTQSQLDPTQLRPQPCREVRLRWRYGQHTVCPTILQNGLRATVDPHKVNGLVFRQKVCLWKILHDLG